MRNHFSNVFIITLVLISCAKPNIINQRFEPEKIVHVSKIENIDNIYDYVVFLDKGDTLPLNLSLDSKILDLADDTINLVLKKKIYLRMELPETLKNDKMSSMNEEDRKKYLRIAKIFISPDAVRWAPLMDRKVVESVKELFGIKGGSFAAGIGISNEEGVDAFLKVKINSIK